MTDLEKNIFDRMIISRKIEEAVRWKQMGDFYKFLSKDDLYEILLTVHEEWEANKDQYTDFKQFINKEAGLP
jgi:hypothetical protein